VMQSKIKRSRRRPKDETCTSVVEYRAEGNSLNRILEKCSLKEVPMENRHEEAKKPLFLLRYE
jgi:hypothetical protein